MIKYNMRSRKNNNLGQIQLIKFSSIKNQQRLKIEFNNNYLILKIMIYKKFRKIYKLFKIICIMRKDFLQNKKKIHKIKMKKK